MFGCHSCRSFWRKKNTPFLFLSFSVIKMKRLGHGMTDWFLNTFEMLLLLTIPYKSSRKPSQLRSTVTCVLSRHHCHVLKNGWLWMGVWTRHGWSKWVLYSALLENSTCRMGKQCYSQVCTNLFWDLRTYLLLEKMTEQFSFMYLETFLKLKLKPFGWLFIIGWLLIDGTTSLLALIKRL